MTRRISLLLVLAVIASLFSFPAVQAEEKTVDYVPYDEYFGFVFGGWDSVRFDDVIQGEDGQAIPYVNDNGGTISGKANSLQIRGWIGYDQEIESFGYIIDDKELVLSKDFFTETEDAVHELASAYGCDYSERFYISIDVSTWTGVHNIKYCAKLADGTVVELFCNNSYPVEFDFIRISDDATATPEPTAIPANEGDAVPGAVFLFNDEYAVEELSMGLSSSNCINDLYFNEELKCAEIQLTGNADPNIYIPFEMMCLERDYEISADEYKAILFCYKFDPAEVFNDSTGETTKGSVYFQTEENTGFSEDKRKAFDVKLTDQIQLSTVDLSKSRKWTGTPYDFRYDFLDDCDNPFTFDLYFIAFFKTAEGANAFAAEYLEKGMDAFPSTPEPTTAPTAAPTSASTDSPAATNAPKATDASKTAAPAADAESEQSGSSAGIIIGIIAAVVVIAIVAIIVIKKKKK